uniref:Uncharacterized protein n=1 Tax=Physcomitrium patens TaxID=3218 RepID=A0A7I4D3M1_PHYPA
MKNELVGNDVLSHRSSTSGANIVGDILYDNAVEDEGHSRQLILAFAAKRYAVDVEKNPENHDALYNWALVLQESADNAGPEVGSPEKDALLEDACKKYQTAVQLCPTLHEIRPGCATELEQSSGTWSHCCIERGTCYNQDGNKKISCCYSTPLRLSSCCLQLGNRAVWSGRKYCKDWKKTHRKRAYTTSCAIYIASAHALKPDYPVGA